MIIFSGYFDIPSLAFCALCGLLAKPIAAVLHTFVLFLEGINEKINQQIDKLWKRN